MVSEMSASCYITPASCYITSASHYHPHYQSRSSMYIRGLIPQNFAELGEAVPIGSLDDSLIKLFKLSSMAAR